MFFNNSDTAPPGFTAWDIINTTFSSKSHGYKGPEGLCIAEKNAPPVEVAGAFFMMYKEQGKEVTLN